jgi:hypothetical protein
MLMRYKGETPVLKRRPKGSGCLTSAGYVYVQRVGGQRAEHRIVMEQIIDRPLRSDESVHHKNGVRHDNRPENLELWSKSHPSGQRVEDKVAWAKEILALYEPAAILS